MRNSEHSPESRENTNTAMETYMKIQSPRVTQTPNAQ